MQPCNIWQHVMKVHNVHKWALFINRAVLDASALVQFSGYFWVCLGRQEKGTQLRFSGCCTSGQGRPLMRGGSIFLDGRSLGDLPAGSRHSITGNKEENDFPGDQEAIESFWTIKQNCGKRGLPWRAAGREIKFWVQRPFYLDYPGHLSSQNSKFPSLRLLCPFFFYKT